MVWIYVKNRGVYIHIPFCEKKCPYCSFYSVETSSGIPVAYIDRVIEEMEEYRGSFVDTLYFGGGTPSLMEPAQMGMVIDRASRIFNITDCEISMEFNPRDATLARLRDYKAAGVNRISVGVQSFDRAKRSVLGREDLDDLKARVGMIRENTQNLSLDMMFGLYGDEALIASEIGSIDCVGPDHISLYAISVDSKTPFYGRVRDKSIIMADSDKQAEIYSAFSDSFSARGYGCYEISNFSKKGYECRHNLKYWHFTEYIGLGASAVGYIEGVLRTNPSDIASYIRGDGAVSERLGAREIRATRIIMGLRLAEGVLLSPSESSVLKAEGFFEGFGDFVELDGRNLRIRESCRYLSDAVIVEILNIIDK